MVVKGSISGAVALCASLCGVLFPAAASADAIDGVKTLSIEVAGHISQHCSMGSIPNVALGNLESTQRIRATRVALDCNVPIDVHVSAANGALTNTLYPAGQGPYAGKLAYQIGFVMPVRRPDLGVVTKLFRSADLVGGQDFNSNGGIAIDGMALAIELAPVARGDGALLGGDYSETIVITVTPS